MKTLTLLTLLTFGVTFAHAQQFKTQGTPNIKFEEMEYDFGVANEGDSVVHIYKFKNIGDAPLVVQNVEPSCGCTGTTWTKEPVMPGRTGQVKAVFDSNGRPGHADKTLTVTTNIPVGGTVQLKLTGEVKPK